MWRYVRVCVRFPFSRFSPHSEIFLFAWINRNRTSVLHICMKFQYFWLYLFTCNFQEEISITIDYLRVDCVLSDAKFHLRYKISRRVCGNHKIEFSIGQDIDKISILWTRLNGSSLSYFKKKLNDKNAMYSIHSCDERDWKRNVFLTSPSTHKLNL